MGYGLQSRQESGPSCGQHLLKDTRGPRASHNVDIMAERRGPVETHKTTHYTDRQTEAWRRALTQQHEKQVDLPLIPLKSKVCQDSCVMSHAVLAPRQGKEEGGQWPAKNSVGEAGSVPQDTGGGW